LTISAAIQRTLIRGPGDKLKIRDKKKPKVVIIIPKTEDLTIATHKLGDLSNPNKGGVESKAITKITPTADIELTITRAVVNPRAKFKEETFIPLAAAPSGSKPI
tara:strand:- start:58 stop:372 length:315 start_codon:yes stop_codon:yes gene_type:complete